MKLCSLLLSLVLVTSAGSAHAARRLELSLTGCEPWSAEEVERLAVLELGTVGGGESDEGSAHVLVECQEQAALIRATEPRTHRALTRSLPVVRATEDGPRLLAISVAQLVRALDWLPEPEPTPAPAPAPQRALRRPPPPPRSRRLELHLAAGPRARDWGSAFATYRGALGSAFSLTRSLQLGAAFSYERGEASRSLGLVRAELLGAAAQLGFEPWRGPRWSCLFRAQTALVRVTLRGVSNVEHVEAGQLRGFGAEAALGVGPVLRWAGVGLSLLGQAGAAELGGTGRVSGSEPVSLNGFWAGAELALLWSP